MLIFFIHPSSLFKITFVMFYRLVFAIQSNELLLLKENNVMRYILFNVRYSLWKWVYEKLSKYVHRKLQWDRSHLFFVVHFSYLNQTPMIVCINIYTYMLCKMLLWNLPKISLPPCFLLFFFYYNIQQKIKMSLCSR